MKFDNRVALIVGADELGSAVAKALAQYDVKIAIADAKKEKAKKLANEIGGDAIGLACDVTNNDQIEAAVVSATEKFGKIDIFIYNVWDNVRKPAEEVSDKLLDQILDINVKGAFKCVRALVRTIKKDEKKIKAMKRYGRIIFLIALSGIMGIKGEVPFSMAQSALIGFMRGVAKELGGRKITVNGVGIGKMDIPFYASYPDDLLSRFSMTQSISGAGIPEDAVDAVLMFASDDNSWTTAELLLVGGGIYSR